VTSDRLTHEFSQLDVGSEYQVWVSAASTVGEGPISNVVIAKTIDQRNSNFNINFYFKFINLV
jgi:hypothetical protein